MFENYKIPAKVKREYLESIKEEYGNLTGAVRLQTKGNDMIVTALNPDRFVTHGWGSFLESLVEREISLSDGAAKFLQHCPYRSGIMGLEFFAGNIMGMWGTEPWLVVPKKDVSVGRNCYSDWISKVAKIE